MIHIMQVLERLASTVFISSESLFLEVFFLIFWEQKSQLDGTELMMHGQAPAFVKNCVPCNWKMRCRADTALMDVYLASDFLLFIENFHRSWITRFSHLLAVLWTLTQSFISDSLIHCDDWSIGTNFWADLKKVWHALTFLVALKGWEELRQTQKVAGPKREWFWGRLPRFSPQPIDAASKFSFAMSSEKITEIGSMGITSWMEAFRWSKEESEFQRIMFT